MGVGCGLLSVVQTSVLVDRGVGRLRISVRLVVVARLVGRVDVVGDVEVVLAGQDGRSLRLGRQDASLFAHQVVSGCDAVAAVVAGAVAVAVAAVAAAVLPAAESCTDEVNPC